MDRPQRNLFRPDRLVFALGWGILLAVLLTAPTTGMRFKPLLMLLIHAAEAEGPTAAADIAQD